MTMTREERRDKATNMRGCNTELFAMRKAILVPDRWAVMTNEEREGYVEATALEAEDVLAPAASQSEGIRKPEHAIEWLNEHDFVGSVMAMRRHPWGAEKNGIYTRFPQTTFTIT